MEWWRKSRKLETTPHWTFSPGRNPECIQAEKDDLVPRDTKTKRSREGLDSQRAQVARKGSSIRVQHVFPFIGPKDPKQSPNKTNSFLCLFHTTTTPLVQAPSPLPGMSPQSPNSASARACFPNAESPHVSVFHNLKSLRISQPIKTWFLRA